jgi:hypothetical protein
LLPSKAAEESKEAEEEEEEEEEESCFLAGSWSPLDPEPEAKAKARIGTLRQQLLKEAEAETENIGTEICIA